MYFLLKVICLKANLMLQCIYLRSLHSCMCCSVNFQFMLLLLHCQAINYGQYIEFFVGNIPSGKLFLFIDLLPFLTAVYNNVFICTIQSSNSLLKGDVFNGFFKFFIEHCFIGCPSDSTMSEDDGIELIIVATFALAVKSNSLTSR